MDINISELIDVTRASSGNIEKLFHGSSSYGYKIGIDWTVNSQSTSSNSSNVTATVYIKTVGSGVTISSTASKTVSLTINGTKYSGTCTVGVGANTKKNLFSKTVTVAHNSDGSKTCTFACALDINVTLSGTYYGKISHEGSGTFNKIILNVAPVWVSGGRVTIKNGSTILTDQANGTENAVKFPENVSSLNISWSGATDANGDTITYELYEQVDNGSWNNIYTGTSKSYTRSIGSGASTQGKMYDYYVKAKDSKGAYASGNQDGTQVQKNTLNGSTLASTSSIGTSTTSIAFSWNAGSNTDGSAVKYDLTANGVTINRATNLTATSLSVAIVDSAPTSGAYILKSDLKNKFASSNYNGTLSFTLTTKNNYGSTKTSSKSISVDLRKNPTPATPTINKNANSTAYHTVATTGNSYFIPDGTKKIRVSWSGGSDYLGTALKYDVQVKIGTGSYETKFSNLTTTYCDLVLPKQTASKSFSIRLITKTAYNYTSYKDSTAETLHYYSQPSVDLISMNRTSTAVTAEVRLNANTSIPNVNFTTRSYTGVTSGTLTNVKTTQTLSASGLTATSKYSWTISVIDDVGLVTTAVTKTIAIPAYTPLFSVREKGVGVNAIPDGSASFIVSGGAKIAGGLTVSDTLKANNALTVAGALTASGGLTVSGTLKANNALTVAGALTASGGLTVGGVEHRKLNWAWGNATPTHIWGSKGSSTDQYVFNGNEIRAFANAGYKNISANGYEGMSLNDGTTSNWIRTTSNGIIPYQSGGASSLGTSSWQFNSIYGKNIYENGTALTSKYVRTDTASTIMSSGNALYIKPTASGNATYIVGRHTDNVNKWYMGSPNANYNVHLRSVSGSVVLRGTAINCKNGDDTAYAQINSSKFNVSSQEKWKTNIQKYNDSALDKILNTTVYNYDLIESNESAVGLVIERGVPQEIVSEMDCVSDVENTEMSTLDEIEKDKGIDLYAMCALSWKAIQEQQEIIKNLKKRIEELETNNLKECI